jgi:hypothetical protein
MVIDGMWESSPYAEKNQNFSGCGRVAMRCFMSDAGISQQRKLAGLANLAQG